MSIENWLSEDGLKAIDEIGWPEWGCSQAEYRLRPFEGKDPKVPSRGFVKQRGSDDPFASPRDDFITEHEARCLLREEARAWLEERHYAVEYLCDGPEYTIYVAQSAEVGIDKSIAEAKDYDAALIAGVLAVGAIKSEP